MQSFLKISYPFEAAETKLGNYFFNMKTIYDENCSFLHRT